MSSLSVIAILVTMSEQKEPENAPETQEKTTMVSPMCSLTCKGQMCECSQWSSTMWEHPLARIPEGAGVAQVMEEKEPKVADKELETKEEQED